MSLDDLVRSPQQWEVYEGLSELDREGVPFEVVWAITDLDPGPYLERTLEGLESRYVGVLAAPSPPPGISYYATVPPDSDGTWRPRDADEPRAYYFGDHLWGRQPVSHYTAHADGSFTMNVDPTAT